MFLYISTKTFWISPIFCGGHPCHPQKSIQVTFDAIKRATAELQDVAWRVISADFGHGNAATKKKGKI